jgi:hypothetical protein
MQKEKTPGNPKDFRRPSSTNRDRYGLDLARARPFDAKSGIFQRIRAPIANPPGLESQKNLPSPQYLPLFPERSNRGLNIYAEGRKRRNLDLGSGLKKMRVEGTDSKQRVRLDSDWIDHRQRQRTENGQLDPCRWPFLSLYHFLGF